MNYSIEKNIIMVQKVLQSIASVLLRGTRRCIGLVFLRGDEKPKNSTRSSLNEGKQIQKRRDWTLLQKNMFNSLEFVNSWDIKEREAYRQET